MSDLTQGIWSTGQAFKSQAATDFTTSQYSRITVDCL
jgi:hypothetical protein